MLTTMSGSFVDPNNAVSHFHLREGERIADFGAGSGAFLSPLSKAVGLTGRVYACEIQKALVEHLALRARSEHLSNVEALWCDLEADGGTKLSSGLLDAGLLSNTLFQFENKESAIRELSRVIKKGGRMFIIDWTDSFGGLGPHQSSVVSEEHARALFESVGFSYERSFETGDHHYGIVMRRS